MLCEVFSQLPLPRGQLTCATTLGALPLLLASVAVLAALLVGLARLRAGVRAALVPALGIGLAAVLLAIAAERPAWVADGPETGGGGGLVVALIDTSDSVWREAATAQAAKARLAARVEQIVEQLDGGEDWRGLVLEFAEGVRAAGPEQGLSRLPDMIRAVAPAGGTGRSDGRAAVEAALERIRAQNGRGAILMLSDGLFDAELPDHLLERAAVAGVPISYLATGSGVPAAGVIAADLGPEQEVGREVTLRATVLGGGELTVSDGQQGHTRRLPDSRQLQPVRMTTRFASRGMRHVRLRYSDGAFTQDRVLFTLVRGPARVLAFGPSRWLDRLPPERWIVERADAAAPPAPGDYDLVVIDGLAPDAFPAGYARALLEASPTTGLFLVNGGLRGSVEEPQVIGDWNGTVLSPILPVDSDPRKFIAEPPGRDIVILIDVSGSMGNSLGLGKQVANRILDQLRPQDSIAILPFSDQPGPQFTRRPAVPSAINAARKFLAGLSAGGGTAPDSTLRAAAKLRTNYCAFFFISDGGFILPPTSPQCHTTAVSTVGLRFPAGVSDWGQEILLSGSVAGITLEYFEPEERETYFRPGSFRPIAAAGDAPLAGLSVPGVAIAYPRTDAEVQSLHSEAPPDPVLVMRRDPAQPGIVTSVFLSELPDLSPVEEIDSVLGGLLGWNRPDRFDIRFAMEGDRLTISVLTLETEGATVPDTLSGTLRIAGQGVQPLAFVSEGAPGRFVAGVSPRLGDAPLPGELVLAEPGQQAQVVPVSLPARSESHIARGAAETFDFGVDLKQLRRMAERTTGVNLDNGSLALDSRSLPRQAFPIHAWIICAGLAFLAGALWTGKRTS